jgi:hypothetical protein
VAQRNSLAVLKRILPKGGVDPADGEYVALNPRRVDRRLGSFRVNLATGRWADFALTDKSARGGDLISLVAYVKGLSQRDAALGLSRMLSGEPPR